MSLRAAAPVLGLATLAGCAGWFAGPTGEEALAAWRAEAREIDARLDEQPSSTGRSPESGVDGTWRAWLEEGELVLIREQSRLGEDGVRDARFYYRDGALRYYLAEGRWPDVDPEGGRRMADVRREIVFDGAGREVADREEVDGVVAPVTPAIIVGARRHAARLERAALGRPPENP